ncbi:GM23055 [Drosophila sechellia]|uniref:GM23055 n=1 Tax=Drosophila sechellia TaxID=7238 RepID=B4I6C5_DROSE|nr:GM23055 [Drosophila sechellia]
MGTSMEEDYRMQDATFCSCFHVFMAQIIAVINNNKNKMAGQDQDDRIGSWFLRRTEGQEMRREGGSKMS